MVVRTQPIFIGNNLQQAPVTGVEGEYVTLLGDTFYRIRNYDAIPPFFMNIISGSNHWLFVATTGGLSAGRVSAEQALFPYYTADKITENSENTGVKVLLLVTTESRTYLWEPFTDRYQGTYRIERNLYKNVLGNAVIFEEINHDLGLLYRYAWRTSDSFGFVKTSWLINQTDKPCSVAILDGLQNLLPAHVTSATQNIFSVLIDAYKRNELEPHTGLGIFSLSSRLSDLAEPSESLRANTVWQIGLASAQYLLSSAQLDRFRNGQGIQQETDIRGRRSAYFVNATFDLQPQAESSWHLVADVNQDSAAVAQLVKELSGDRAALGEFLERDIANSTNELRNLVGSADGLQLTHNRLETARHFANVLFNIMRGGIFADQYQIDTADLRDFVAVRNTSVLEKHSQFFDTLPESMEVHSLWDRADASGSADLIRLCYAYLPLTFSRRHGDPSRPWNQFAINVRKADGSRQLDYAGNWRDIFQNWEALTHSYPEFLMGMITNFLSATTAEGYNPYRVTRNGIDWEIPNPSDPWANIGYWSDHQIIYLQKLLELEAEVHPGELERLLTRPMFSYANVPYRIKEYRDLFKDPYDTIVFDWQLEKKIEGLVKERGTDGKLVLDAQGQVLHTTLAEKLLTLLLAKLVNFVPEGGIWMITQRPEWNDANNALVGKGLSVVTLSYLRRFISFCSELFATSNLREIPITAEVNGLFEAISKVLIEYRALLGGSLSDEQRRTVMDGLGQAGSDYRWNYYQHGFSGTLTTISTAQITAFLELAQRYVEHTLRANKREDNLYHAYNILHLDSESASVSYLYEMLEGQVAILSSGLLSSDDALTLLNTMRHSTLYRADQQTYILYPNRSLPGFLEKNCIGADAVRESALVAALVADQDPSLIVKDINGAYHFSGSLRNAKDVARSLTALGQQPKYAALVAAESEAIQALFERVFQHDAFTGRSGTFFAYEGLGSIYWHMVSKLLLAAQETVRRAILAGEPKHKIDALVAAYFDIRAGSSVNKTPDVYGAFPTDPYSHTPEGQGAKQPGMTGMVKEEILTRLAELGLYIKQGSLEFDPVLVRAAEFLTEPALFDYVDIHGHDQQISLPTGSLAYTFCQVPIVLQASTVAQITVHFSAGGSQVIAGNVLDNNLSQHIFWRDGVVQQLTVALNIE